MKGEIRDVVVGIVTLAVLAAVAVMSFARSDFPKTGTYDVIASFARIDGLLLGDEVRMGGIKIGTVARQELTENFRATLTLQINSDVVLPKDTSAAIHTEGLFGSKYIELDPGGDTDEIKPGGTIVMTQDSLVVEDLLEMIIGEAKVQRAKRAGESPAKSN